MNYYNNYDNYQYNLSETYPPISTFPYCSNELIYFKYPESPIPEPQKVLVNPHFSKKVFINPNFGSSSIGKPKIHINPNIKSIHINPKVQKIHVNPNILKTKSLVPNVSLTVDSNSKNLLNIVPKNSINRTVVSTRMKIIRVPENSAANIENIRKQRRNSIRTKYKIVKASTPFSSPKFTSTPYKKTNYQIDNTKIINKFNISISSNISKTGRRKYVYINRFTSISEIAKNILLKQNKTKSRTSRLVNISGTLYKISPNRLRKTSNNKKEISTKSTIVKSKYKFVRTSLNMKSKGNVKQENNRSLIKQCKIIRCDASKKLVQTKKMKKCNLPCPVFRRYGKCKGKDNGSCYRKHDPDQIILCAKFLQGACLNEKCLLSHKVSAEKMPTCKYYLEGLCSKDNCPYLHVKINPKADICRDFLEGYCKKAAECNKRHQLLCPDFEKNASCPKKRCPYPHGNLVRINSVFKKFAKKCSKKTERVDCNKKNKRMPCKEQNPVSTRYYTKSNKSANENFSIKKMQEHGFNSNSDIVNDCDQEDFVRSRPKLGTLPSFIPLNEDE